MIIQKSVDPFDKFSTLGKLVRVVAMCLRVVRICRKERVLGPLSVEELNHAMKCLVKREQRLAFLEEISALKGEDAVSASLKQINPWLDKDKMMRRQTREVGVPI